MDDWRVGRAVVIGVMVPVGGLVALFLAAASPWAGGAAVLVALAGVYAAWRWLPGGSAPAASTRSPSQLAVDRMDADDPGGPETTKACPDCAETILGAARVCRFCGYRFDVGLSAPEAARAVARRDKSPFGAAVMSFLVPGLGQFYLGEWWRGAAFFGSFWIMLVAAIYTDTIGLAWLIGLIAAVDAYRGAVEVRETGAPRVVTGRVWLLVVVSVGLSIAGIVNYEEPSEGGGQSMREFRLDNYDRCISSGLSELECGRIYLDY